MTPLAEITCQQLVMVFSLEINEALRPAVTKDHLIKMANSHLNYFTDDSPSLKGSTFGFVIIPNRSAVTLLTLSHKLHIVFIQHLTTVLQDDCSRISLL